MAEDPEEWAEEWSNTVEEEATFLPSTISTDDPLDYQKWVGEERGWRKLRASVLGGAALDTAEGRDYASQQVVAQSLMDSGAAFHEALEALTWLENFVRDQSAAVAGPERAWQGLAADAFLAKMEYFADFIGRHAQRIAGGHDNGPNSIPNQLYESAAYLKWAQETVDYLDEAWADVARANGIGKEGELAPISGTEYEKPMARQMGQVIETLATRYEHTYNSVRPPTEDTLDTPTPPPPEFTTPPPLEITPPPEITVPEITVPEITTPELTPPDLSTPDLSTPDLSTPDLSTPELSTPDVSTPEFTTSDFPSPTVTTPDLSTLDLAPPNDTGPVSPNVNVPTIPDGPTTGFGGPDSPVGGPGGNGPMNPPVMPGAPIGGPLPPGGNGGNRPPVTSPGAPIGGPPGGDVRPEFRPPVVPPPPDGVGGPGSNVPGGVDIPGLDGPPAGGPVLPEAPGLDTRPGLDDDDLAAPPMAPGLPGGGMPMMPGGPGAGGGPGSGGNLPEAPDAGGLVGGNPEDWGVSGPPIDVPDAPSGTTPGGDGLGGVPSSPGMPGMPGGGAPGAGGGGSGLPEAPDAGGLVGGNPEDWGVSSPEDIDVPDAPGGTTPGGDGLGGVPSSPGMPMMPGMPGGGPPTAGNGNAPDAPDAKGLVDGDPENWQTDGVPDEPPGAPGGVQAGGAGLTGPATFPATAARRPGDAETPDEPNAKDLVEEDAGTWAAADATVSEAPGPDRAVAVVGAPEAGVVGVLETESVGVPEAGIVAAPDARTVKMSTAGQVVVSGPVPPYADDRAPLERPAAAEHLGEDEAAWSIAPQETAGDFVPVVSPDDGDDLSGWDDAEVPGWLTERRQAKA